MFHKKRNIWYSLSGEKTRETDDLEVKLPSFNVPYLVEHSRSFRKRCHTDLNEDLRRWNHPERLLRKRVSSGPFVYLIYRPRPMDTDGRVRGPVRFRGGRWTGYWRLGPGHRSFPHPFLAPPISIVRRTRVRCLLSQSTKVRSTR